MGEGYEREGTPLVPRKLGILLHFIHFLFTQLVNLINMVQSAAFHAGTNATFGELLNRVDRVALAARLGMFHAFEREPIAVVKQTLTPTKAASNRGCGTNPQMVAISDLEAFANLFHGELLRAPLALVGLFGPKACPFMVTVFKHNLVDIPPKPMNDSVRCRCRYVENNKCELGLGC
jgi:hypothetical protein